MVRAILEGRKTQTRRTLKVQPRGHHWEFLQSYQLRCRLFGTGNGLCARFSHHIKENPLEDCVQWVRCPYGQPGDRLWVRETWQVVRETTDYETGGESDIYDWPGTLEEARQHLNGDARFSTKSGLYYAADGEDVNPCNFYDLIGLKGEVLAEREMRWRSSIHMPRWASRILLEIVSVRVERLQDISKDDIKAEGGCQREMMAFGPNPAEAFPKFWDSINGAGSWDASPWVWVVEFKRVEA
ncbi:hypothetical protein [Methylobacterium aquaticum]|uniref:hypothetical protein n=1 Tax=Methylobacterium aquaticum TaxID=270351 RepID=UPI001AF1C210|nr:hypothetical protein F1D61_28675 [Methylobacterium aquaticum]